MLSVFDCVAEKVLCWLRSTHTSSCQSMTSTQYVHTKARTWPAWTRTYLLLPTKHSNVCLGPDSLRVVLVLTTVLKIWGFSYK